MESLLIKRLGRKKPKISSSASSEHICKTITRFLDDRKAMELITVPLEGKSSIADYLVIASGGSQRHISSMAEDLSALLRTEFSVHCGIEGIPQCDWVLIDAGDIIVHLFRPEVRAFYNIEKMWNLTFDDPQEIDARA